MINSLDDLMKFASENNISPEFAFQSFRLASFIGGMITFHLIEEVLKSTMVKMILQKAKKKFKKK